MKTVMVTGANVGIGKEAARQAALIKGVQKVILACRSKSKADAAKEDLEKVTGKNIFEVVVLDTSDLSSVRKAAASVGAIDGLIMNAGGLLEYADLTSDGVTTSFAANVLGHVVLTEELIKAGKLSGSVIFASSEAVRGEPPAVKRIVLSEHSVDEFKKVADGSFIAALKPSDPRMGSYGLIKFMGTLWTSHMARKHPNIRFISVSPGATRGTNVMTNVNPIMRFVFGIIMFVFSFFGGSHDVETGAKRYIDVLTDKSYETGEFYASKKGLAGPMSVQSEAKSRIVEYKDEKIQDNAAQAIHDILNQKDFENKAKAKAQANTAA